MSVRIFPKLFEGSFGIPRLFNFHKCLVPCAKDDVKLVRHFCRNQNKLLSTAVLKDCHSVHKTCVSNKASAYSNLNLSAACSQFTVRGLKTDSYSAKPIPATNPSSGIQQNIASLQAKKRVARKKRSAKEQEEGLSVSRWSVVAYATADEYNLEKLVDGLQQQGLYHPVLDAEDSQSEDSKVSSRELDTSDVLHVSAKYTVGKEPREIYFFREGSAVFWNVPELERQNVLKFLRSYEENSYDENIVNEESEMMTYRYTEPHIKTRLSSGEIGLSPEGSTNLEKYTFANAMALSVKLGIWEASLDHYIDSIEFVTEDLKVGAKIRISREEVLRKTGELFALRHLINLSSDLLDTPDFYWDRENLEDLYHKTCNHLNIGKRTKVMNEKLNHCVELVELLSSHLSDSHHTRLEWMIIILIMVEVVFEFLHYAQRFIEAREAEA